MQGFSAQIEGKTSMLNGLQYLESPDSIPKDSFRIPAAGNSGRRLQKKPSAGQPHSSDDGSGRNINLDCFDEPTKKGLEDNNESKPEPEKDDDADSMSPTEVADDVENEPKKKKSRWRRWKFWRRELPIAVSLVLMATTVTLYVMQRNLIVGYFALWRWTLFFSLFGPVYIVSHAIMHSLVSFMETHFLATRRMLYYIIGMRKGVERLLRAGLIIGIFAAIFQDRARVRGVRDVYTVLLRLLCCIVLFASANVVKTLLAKLMSSHFYQETHFQKMQDALRKEFFLLALSQPRHDMGDPEEAESPGRPTGMAGLRTKSFAAAAEQGPRGASFSHMRSPLAPATATPSSAPTSPKGGQASYTTGSKGGSELPQRQPQRAAPSFTRTASMQSQRSYKSDDRKSLQSLASMMTDGKAPSARGRSRLAFARVGTQEKVDAQKAAMPVSLPSKPSQDHDFIAKLHMVEKHIRKNKLKLTFSDQLGRAQHASNDVSSQSEAKKLAFYIFWNVKSKHDRNHVVKEDFHPFLSKDRIDEAFETLDLDKDGKISLGDMRDSVLKIYQNRKNLALTLKDTKTVVGKLERIFGGCIHFLFVFFYLTIWGVDLSKVWFTTSSMLLSFVFVFGNSIRSVYESVVFLFVVHPFDVGDGVLVGQSQDYCVVEEIALLNTTLLRWDGARILYPNSKLNSDQLINVSRSANKGEVFKVLVDIGTPKSVFDSIDASLKDFVKGNPDFNNVSCNPGSPADPYKFTLSIYYELSFNSSDRGRYGGARIGIYWAIIEALAKENLQYTLPPYRSGPSDAQPLPTPHAGAGATGLPVLM
ncbi:hypothetical protein WJX72_006541 [[Myrmecia] bisecta]|uniref:EF-hand domain-containing protein n=1 Tax=[Myrmecia] bisecta TaxID=41462 RepID=A0AAW1R7F3_9CHLO